MTELIYMNQPSLFKTTAQITKHGIDHKGQYIILDQTIFYPQGGGQPSDQGRIMSSSSIYNVTDVRLIDNEVRHYIEGDGTKSNLNSEVQIEINQDRRFRNSQYHSAGHFIAAVTEQISYELRAIKGHHFPGESYVEFNGVIDTNLLEQITKTLQINIANNNSVITKELNLAESNEIAKSLPYSLPKNKTLRACVIEGFPPAPCGGTHVKSLQEIEGVVISKVKSKKGKSKIYYEV